MDIRDYGKKVHNFEIEFDETNDKLQKAIGNNPLKLNFYIFWYQAFFVLKNVSSFVLVFEI